MAICVLLLTCGCESVMGYPITCESGNLVIAITLNLLLTLTIFNTCRQFQFIST